MKRIAALVVLLVVGSAFAERSPKPAQVSFDKFKNVTRVSTDTLDRANAGKVTYDGGKDAHVIVRSVGLGASLACEGQVTKCTPKVIELLFIGNTADWSMKCDHINLLIDGKPETIKADWDGQVLSGDDLREYIDTNPTPELLVELANAKTVDVQIGLFDFTLSDTAIAVLKDLATHIDGVAITPSQPTSTPTVGQTQIDRDAFAKAMEAASTTKHPEKKATFTAEGTRLIVHSPVLTKDDWDKQLSFTGFDQFMDMLKKMGFTAYVNTNDKDLTFTQEIK